MLHQLLALSHHARKIGASGARQIDVRPAFISRSIIVTVFRSPLVESFVRSFRGNGDGCTCEAMVESSGPVFMEEGNMFAVGNWGGRERMVEKLNGSRSEAEGRR